MAIRGHNLYIGGVKVNDEEIPAGTQFTADGLPSSSDLALTATNVDDAGLEGPPSVVFPFSTPAYDPAVGISLLSQADRDAIDAIVAASMVESKQPGVIISITGPRGYYSRAYGNATKRPITTDDHFRMGSTTKTFTATAFWRMVDAGLVTLDDYLEDFVPGVPKGDQIKMRHLLSMRSGVYDYQSHPSVLLMFTVFPTAAFNEASALRYIKGNPSQFTPGEAYQYTNSNFVLIGAVVEAIDPGNRDIRNIIMQDIVTPLGLTETTWPRTANNGQNTVIPAPRAAEHKYNPELFGAAGAMTSTVGDMIKWAQAMRDGTVISAASRDEWHALANFYTYPANFDDPPPEHFGYGLAQESTGTWLGHNGSIPNFGTQVAFDTVSGAMIAVSENKQTTSPVVLAAYTRIFRKIAKQQYPASMDEPDYLGKTTRPRAALLALVGGRADVVVEPADVVMPRPAQLAIIGGQPLVMAPLFPRAGSVVIVGGTPLVTQIPQGGVLPRAARLALVGGRPDVTIVTSFTPFNEENVDRIARAVPVGSIGAWVTAIGAGGGGGAGRRNTSSNVVRGGGGGGGGGARVNRVFVPIASMGATYDTTRGLKGLGGAQAIPSGNGGNGQAGGASTFASGSVSIAAGGGSGGGGGFATSAGGSGAAGTPSVSGVTATTANGRQGGAGGTSGAPPAPNANPDGAGAGGGGGGGTNGSDTRHAGQAGANSVNQFGAGGGALGQPGGSTAATGAAIAGAGAGGGGASLTAGNSSGGDALGYGGGGGGAGAVKGNVDNAPNPGGDGGDGYLLVEWV